MPKAFLFRRTMKMNSAVHHPDLAFQRDDGTWQSWSQFSASKALPHEAVSLSFAGLFTEYLKALNLGEVRVELIRQGPLGELASAEFHQRDVAIYVGEQRAAVASTLIPISVLGQHDWLSSLGGKAIGEALETRLSARRCDVEYREVRDSELVGNFGCAGPAWGRRYRYVFVGGQVSITEVIAHSIVASIAELGER